MTISLKEYFIALSTLLDFLEMEMHSKPTNHCKRVALLTLRMADLLKLPDLEKVPLGALSLLHDLGASKALLIQKMEKQKNPDIEVFPDHCKAGSDIIREIPFLSDRSDVILYHHERYDGKGYYGEVDKVPLFSKLITISDRMDMEMYNKSHSKEDTIKTILSEKGRSFAPDIAELGLEVLSACTTESALDDQYIEENLSRIFPEYTQDISEEDMLEMTGAFSSIVDAKSPFTRNHSSSLAEKTEKMCGYYHFDRHKTVRMIVAANLHDIGKLMVPNRILEKDGKLTTEEFAIIKQHTFYTRKALSHISGWEDITDWASDHHEKLNGKGYPFGKTAEQMPFESRLMACLDIYQALTEDRPYKKGFDYEKSFRILDDMVENGGIDGSIVKDMKEAFS